MKIKILYGIFSIFINFYFQFSWAGDHKGNGADIVSCQDRSILLDFYENDVDSAIENIAETEIVINLLNQVKEFTPIRVQNYQNQVLSFYNETRFVSGNDLGEVIDSGGTTKKIPENCKLVQGVLQKKIVFGNEKRYLINQVEWEKLSNLNKAGVILHEIIYRELQSPTSHKIRLFNSWLFNHINQKINPHEFYEKIKMTGFEWVYLYQIPFNAQYLITNEENIRSLSTYPGLKFTVLNNEVESVEHFVDSYLNGRPKQIQFKGSIRFEDSQYQIKFCEDYPRCNINFNEDGSILKINHANIYIKNSEDTLKDKSVIFSKEGKIEQIF